MGIFSYLLGGLASTLVSIPALHVLSSVTHAPVFSFAARCIASYLALLTCACYGVIASALLNVAGYGGLSQWTTARAFKWTMWGLTGVWFDVRDLDGGLKVRPGVFVGNHQTELDVLMLGAVFPKYTSVTAKNSLKYVPFLGWFMMLSKTVFIDRKSRSAAISAFASAAETMHINKQSTFIFAEGTRSYASSPTMLPFKKGAFHLAVQAQVPIVPVVVANYNNVLDVKRKIFNAGVIPVSILKPVETKGLAKEDVDGLVTKVRDMMEKELVRISKHAEKEGIASHEKAVKGADRAGKSSGIDLGITG